MKWLEEKGKEGDLHSQPSTKSFSYGNYTLESKYGLTNYNHSNQGRDTGSDLHPSIDRALKKKYDKRINPYEPIFKNYLKTEM